MSPSIPCPPTDQLRDFAAGRLLNPPAELEEHLLACEACAETTAELDVADTLIASLRQIKQQTPPPWGADAELLRELMAVCSGLHAGDDGATQISGAETAAASSQAPPEDVVRELSAAWRPAEQTDELGRLGGYRILSMLGSGGMGAVFLAEDVHLRRQVALKLMRPRVAAGAGATERFLLEARSAAALHHDHILTIYQVGQEQGVPFLAMEYLQGETLDSRLEREQSLPLDQTLRIGREIAEGLAAAHAKGLVHRDIKPSNVWLEAGRDRVKLLDFGLARSMEADVQLTTSGMILGTPAYMAPEQASGNAVDARTDLFSLGVLLYRLTTGVLPFAGRNTLEMLHALANVVPAAPRTVNPGVPQDLSDLISRLLAKNPDQRPANALDVANRLAEVAAQSQRMTEVLPASDTRLPRRRPPLRRWMAGGFAAAVLLAAIWIIVKDKDGKTVAKIPVPEQGSFTASASEPSPELQKSPQPEPALAESPIAEDADEAAIEWALSIGALVFQYPNTYVTRAGDLSWDALWGLDLGVTSNWTDADLARLSSCKRLRTVGFHDSKIITDAGLAHLRPVHRLAYIELSNCPKITDAGLEHLRSLHRLNRLDLVNCEITDAGLEHLRPLHELTYLRISECHRVTDRGLRCLSELSKLQTFYVLHTRATPDAVAALAADHMPLLEFLYIGPGESTPEGLASLKKLPHLRSLSVTTNHDANLTDAHVAELSNLKGLMSLAFAGTEISDAGWEHISKLVNLTSLQVYQTEITGAGARHLGQLKKLESLQLSLTSISDAGLNELSTLQNLALLQLDRLQGPGVTDAGLVGFRDHPQLVKLMLDRTQITDESVDVLTTMPKLREVHLGITKVTAEGVARLHRERPECTIHSDFGEFTGTPQPAANPAATDIEDPDEAAIEWAFSIGAPVFQHHSIIGFNYVARASDLPWDALWGIDLGGVPGWTEADLDRLSGCKRLRTITFEKSNVTDAALARLRPLHRLAFLELSNCPAVTDAGLEHLRSLHRLNRLGLKNCGITDAGLEHLRPLLRLSRLDLVNCEITDAGLEHLRPLRMLDKLTLADCHRVTDQGLRHLSELSQVSDLIVRQTRATPDAVAALAAGYMPLLERLEFGPGESSPEGLALLKKLPHLRSLVMPGNQEASLTDAHLAELSQLSGLTQLTIHGREITEAGWEHVSRLVNLTHLAIYNVEITAAAGRHLSQLSKLQDLVIINSSISDSAFNEFSPPNSLIRLHTSFPRGPGVTDAGLIRFRDHPALAHFSLAVSQITDESVDILLTMPKLRWVDLTKAKVTAEGVARLHRERPDCTIYSDFGEFKGTPPQPQR